MGKAKLLGGASVGIGIALGLISWILVPGSFIKFLVGVYLPVLLVTVGIVAVVLGLLLLVYG